MPNRNLCRIALAATLLLAATASAQEDEEEQAERAVYARPGFYVGAGFTTGFPVHWNSDVDNELNEDASDLAEQAASNNLGAAVNRLELVVDDADIEDVLVGANGLVGYRAADTVAFEVEAEGLFGSNESDLDITGSVGRHKIKVEEFWTLTANMRMFLPTDWRFQPSAVFGLGLHHSKLETDVVTSGLMTTDSATRQINVPADFVVRESRTKLTGAIRVGAGIDVYATPNIVGQMNASYVMPFDKVGNVVNTDYMSLVWRLIYRF